LISEKKAEQNIQFPKVQCVGKCQCTNGIYFQTLTHSPDECNFRCYFY